MSAPEQVIREYLAVERERRTTAINEVRGMHSDEYCDRYIAELDPIVAALDVLVAERDLLNRQLDRHADGWDKEEQLAQTAEAQIRELQAALTEARTADRECLQQISETEWWDNGSMEVVGIARRHLKLSPRAGIERTTPA